MVVYEDKNRDNYIRIYNVKDTLAHGKNKGACDHVH